MFFRRLLALFYDLLLIAGILLSFTLLIVIINGGAISSILGSNLMLSSYILISFIFYIYFWYFNEGQTLGMQGWKIRCVDLNGRSLSFRRGITRFVLATLTLIPFGFGFFWILVHREHITVYDDMSLSRIVYLGENPYRSEQSSKKDPGATT